MKPHMRAIVAFLDDIGAHSISIVNGGKHPRVVFWYGDKEHQRVISGTPANADECVRRAIEDIRRACGLINHEKRVGARRKARAPARRRRAYPGELPAPVLAAPPQLDWRDRLTAHPYGRVILRARLDAAWRAWWADILADVRIAA